VCRVCLRIVSAFFAQLRLYAIELNGKDDVPASLVVVKQPFPCCISKGKRLLAEQFVVQLLSGAAALVTADGPVVATLKWRKDVPRPPSTLTITPLLNNEQPLDVARGLATFPLEFNTGTRKHAVRVSVSMRAVVRRSFVPPVSTAAPESALNDAAVAANQQRPPPSLTLHGPPSDW
jgi:hypothetical protein